ncbi:uncharacterized protein PITG_18933 [Phytophthora infestans T30-4]|uniref:Uncharacterized protein n=1 Tax=Phytophthora infestans (strain T30-4) TaxID=403677 RepID=D0P018_PHYIT|nr:uncharacterized protein PITG_18933 [Phytophthora infestans T30-4]EEY70178.1 conserved hypothetical protein [Phytophthora infestans T30-4]|eukprot:XP_002997039.1 conserved hypothetical protein [Phytophthora infestans T30-4]
MPDDYDFSLWIRANYIDVPTAYYGKERGHKSWYQGLRYAANNYCKQNAEEKQDYATFAASVKAGITENTCAVDTCPASGDVNAELSLIVGKGKDHWGINSNGTCYPLINSYMGSYLCDPDNMFSKCASPRNESTTPKSNAISAFNYQIDAISSWCATPPNPGKECRGLGDADNFMQVGCDPASHPTQEWIEAHIDEYEDNDNKWEEVAGKARTALKTGKLFK